MLSRASSRTTMSNGYSHRSANMESTRMKFTSETRFLFLGIGLSQIVAENAKKTSLLTQIVFSAGRLPVLLIWTELRRCIALHSLLFCKYSCQSCENVNVQVGDDDLSTCALELATGCNTQPPVYKNRLLFSNKTAILGEKTKIGRTSNTTQLFRSSKVLR
jgi:hypothetical protein